MRNTELRLCVTLALVSAAAAGGLLLNRAEATDVISTKLEVSYVSKYVWRGIPQTAEGAVQPSLTFSHPRGLSYNFWASNDVDAGKLTEHDHTLSYTWNTGSVAVNAGCIYYAFPNTPFPSTSEIYAGACFGGRLSPSVSINYDIDEARGFYASLTGGYTCPVQLGKTAPANLNLSARLSFSSAGYNRFWFGKDKAALNDLYLTAAAPITVGNKAGLTPWLGYWTIIDSGLRNALADTGLKADNFVWGLMVSFAF